MTHPALQNCLVAVAAASAIWLAWHASRRTHWRLAARQIADSRLATASLAVIFLYVTIGVLDSVSWRDRAVGTDGTPVVDPSGRPVYDALPRSVLDRLCAPLVTRQEKTYSPPFADRLFSRETTKTPDGKTVRERPMLAHPHTHPLGTDRIGNDVLYSSLKGVRTALLIGGLTTVLVIPFALLFGVPAGYFGGRVDDAVQYFYTTLASIPDILLITAFMLMAGRGLLPLCIILGITSWTGLCRLLRGETLKLREMEYVQAARALGLSPLRIMTMHIIPNLMHIVLISSVLRFSALVLTEAVLSYLGLGVEPGTGSWGHMINMTRLELSREPLVWWNFAAAFAFMFGLVLPVNIFGDALRDALDPRLRTK
jgi:peptide/nickel transport system permease protein